MPCHRRSAVPRPGYDFTGRVQGSAIACLEHDRRRGALHRCERAPDPSVTMTPTPSGRDQYERRTWFPHLESLRYQVWTVNVFPLAALCADHLQK